MSGKRLPQDSDSSSEDEDEMHDRQQALATRPLTGVGSLQEERMRTKTHNPLSVQENVALIHRQGQEGEKENEVDHSDTHVCLRPPDIPCLKYNALFVLSGTNPVRILLLNLTRHFVFETIIIFLILGNCVMLALDDPTNDHNPQWMIILDYFFTSAFCFEAFCKILSLGFFFHKGSYLRNPWNCLDFFIVLLALLNYLPIGFGSFTAFRVLRVLRPLRSMNAVPGLKIIVVGLLKSLGGLLSVLMLAFFIFAIFGILGVQLFGGTFRQRCINLETNVSDPFMYCNAGADDGNYWGRKCPPGFGCQPYRNPKFGYLHFDDLGIASLTIFTIVTFEGWTDILMLTYQVYGMLSFLYFFVLIMVASYLVPNLALAVINDRFMHAQQEHQRLLENQRASERAKRTEKQLLTVANLRALRNATTEGSKLTLIGRIPAQVSQVTDTSSVISVPLQLQAPHQRRGSNSSVLVPELRPPGVDEKTMRLEAFSHGSPSEHSLPNGLVNKVLETQTASSLSLEKGVGEVGSHESGNSSALAKLDTLPVIPPPMSVLTSIWVFQEERGDQEATEQGVAALENTAGSLESKPNSPSAVLNPLEGEVKKVTFPKSFTERALASMNYLRDTVHHFTEGYSLKIAVALYEKRKRDKERLDQGLVEAPKELEEEVVPANPRHLHSRKSAGELMKEMYEEHAEWHDVDGVPPDDQIEEFVDGAPPSYFTRFIILCIFLNTLTLAAQHFQQPDWLDHVSDISNKVFTGIFGAEFVLRLFGMGPLYALDPFNILDGVVVTFSFIELGLAGSNTVSVFRALRLLRVLKLLKRFPSLRQIIRVTLAALGDTGYLNIIILLYLFIASLIGMQFFGGELRQVARNNALLAPENISPQRANFDSFFDSFLAVFQVLTRDGWNDLMYMSMYATTPAACVYFVSLCLIGDYTLLALFLAILISAFGDEKLDDEEEEVSDVELKVFQMTADSLKRKGFLSLVGRERKPEEVIRVTQSMQRELDRLKERRKRRQGRTLTSVGFCDTPNVVPAPTQNEDEETSHEGKDGFAPFQGTVNDELSSNSDDQVRCEVCGGLLEEVLPPPPLIPLRSRSQLHTTHCAVAAVRLSKQKVLGALRTYVKYHVEEGIPPTKNAIEVALGQAWSCGLLLSENPEDIVACPDPWQALQRAVKEQDYVLNLKVGEEQVGRSLVTYICANVPHEHETNGGYALFVFGPKNTFRLAVSGLISNSWFDTAILFFIIISSLSMIFDNPLEDPADPQYETKYKVLDVLDNIFTAIFTTEMCLKWIAKGIIFHEGAYLRDPWNILDGGIVILSLISVVLTDVDLSFIKVFRTFRALRPLRVINRNRGLKMVVRTLLQSISGISNVAMLSLLNYLVFGILGVEFFSGSLYRCTDPRVTYRLNCTGNFTTTGYDDNGAIVQSVNPRVWVNAPRNFDHIGNAILTMFEVSTAEWWVGIMYDCIDAVDFDHAPSPDNRPYMGLFFVVFHIVGNFFLLNLFVGVVIYNFNSVKSQMDGLSLLTEEQKLWVNTQRLMLNFRPTVLLQPKKSRQLATMVSNIIQTDIFEAVIGAAIFLNIITIGMDYADASDEYEFALGICNYFFVAVFSLEMFSKQFAFGIRYFSVGWNRFDCFLVVLSWIGVALDAAGSTSLPINVSILRVFRIFRIMRVLRLVKQARQVRVLVETLWYSLPSLGNIGLFMLLIFFIFAVLGVQLFAKVDGANPVVMDNRYSNFRTFENALQLLFRFTTVTDWNGVMHDCMVQEPFCTGSGCGTPAAPLYFLPFVIMSSFVITNLFIAIILDNFETTMKLEKSALKMSDLQRFIDIWAIFDEEATLLMPTKRFTELLAELRPPLGIPRQYNRLDIIRQTQHYRVPEHGGYVHFVEVLIPLARCVMKVHWKDRQIREHEMIWRMTFPNLQQLPILRYRERCVTVDQYFCATYISSAFKGRRCRQAIVKKKLEREESIIRWCLENDVPYQPRDGIDTLLSHVDRIAAKDKIRILSSPVASFYRRLSSAAILKAEDDPATVVSLTEGEVVEQMAALRVSDDELEAVAEQLRDKKLKPKLCVLDQSREIFKLKPLSRVESSRYPSLLSKKPAEPTRMVPGRRPRRVSEVTETAVRIWSQPLGSLSLWDPPLDSDAE
jgi:hypothetical protein